MIQTQSYLARVEKDNGKFIIVNHITGEDILQNLPMDIPFQVQFLWESPVKRTAEFHMDQKGHVPVDAIHLLRRPGAKVTVEWEE